MTRCQTRALAGHRARILELCRTAGQQGAPTVRELAASIGIATSTVHHHLLVLAQCGLLTPGAPGCWRRWKCSIGGACAAVEGPGQTGCNHRT